MNLMNESMYKNMKNNKKGGILHQTFNFYLLVLPFLNKNLTIKKSLTMQWPA
jgi:hypothetical protein